MSAFRAKQMTLDQWAPFRDRFEALFAGSGGDRALALFIRSAPGSDLSTLLIPGGRSQAVEALSPDGWVDLPDAQEAPWALLVGNASAADDFGITLG